jgi:hypothetical protein
MVRKSRRRCPDDSDDLGLLPDVVKVYACVRRMSRAEAHFEYGFYSVQRRFIIGLSAKPLALARGPMHLILEAEPIQIFPALLLHAT